MKKIRVDASKFIFNQKKKAGIIRPEVEFDISFVDFSDIDIHESYYKSIYFEPSTASSMATKGGNSSAADASHCEGKGKQSYGTVAATLVYDANRNINPLAFQHFIGNEGSELWNEHFLNVSEIDGFDRLGRVTFVDMEKAIASGYKKSMTYAKLFYDQNHVMKNMDKHLGSGKGHANNLFRQAVKAPSHEKLMAIKGLYSDKQGDYLAKFDDDILYVAESKVDNIIFTSQGAESEMNALMKIQVRSIEPQKMLWKVALEYKRRFDANAAEAAECECPVPPRVERHIAHLIIQAKKYSIVRALPNTNMNEYEVICNDGRIIRVIFSPKEQTPPICCAFSKVGDGYPCYHGVAAIIDKYGVSSVHKFIDARHLTKTWKEGYVGLEFRLPDQSQMDTVMIEAKKLVSSGQSLRVPKAIPPTRGRPGNDAGKRKQSFYEKGQGHKKRAHCCSYCGLSDHVATHCPLRQAESSDDDM